MTNISAIKRRENRLQSHNRPHYHSSPSTSSSQQGEEGESTNDGVKSRVSKQRNEPDQKLYRDAASDDDRYWTPTFSTAFKILVSLRMSAGLWSPISDCDEVFNYWEPLHLLLYGHGLQTWEYSPVYAIRSWAYILLHGFPLKLFQIILPHTKVTTFFYLRCFLGFASGAVEAYLYRVLSKRLGNGIGRLFVFFSAVSCGMFVASSAFLPSSFSMILNGLSLALWLDNRLFLAVLCTAVSALIGWPFAAVLGFPIVAHFIQKKRILRFTGYALLCGLSVCGFLVAVDTHYYGKTVLAPLNIVLYNVFSEHGPTLYGTEPFSFYVINLLLNWNIVFPLSLVGLPLSAAYFYLCRSPSPAQTRRTVFNSVAYFSRLAPVLYLSLSMFLWMFIFFSQPHKEERFLFPIYPLLAVNAAIALDALHQLSRRLLINYPQLRSVSNYALASTLILFMVTSWSRSLGLYRNYHAPFDVYMALGEKYGKDYRLNATRNHVEPPVYQVCVGKEWYRFPSSFFLPEDPRFRLAFVESEFNGLLPKYYNTTMDSNATTMDSQDVVDSSGTTMTKISQQQIQYATSRIPDTMNDGNLQERDRFVSSLTACDFLVDLDAGVTTGPSELEPNYSQNSADWTIIESRPFLLKAASPSPLLRAFYIPYFSARYCAYGAYNLLLSTRYVEQQQQPTF